MPMQSMQSMQSHRNAAPEAGQGEFIDGPSAQKKNQTGIYFSSSSCSPRAGLSPRASYIDLPADLPGAVRGWHEWVGPDLAVPEQSDGQNLIELEYYTLE